MRCYGTVAIVSAIIVGCASEPTYLPKVHGPDGRTWWELECPTRMECREELSRQCPSGYKVLDEATEDDGATAARIGTVTVIRHRERTSLLFRCKNDP